MQNDDTANALAALVQVATLLQFAVIFRVHGIRNTATLLPQKVPHWIHSNAVHDSELPTPISNGGLTAAAPPQCAKSARGGDPTPKKQYR